MQIAAGFAAAALLFAWSGAMTPARAQSVEVRDAWVRGTVPAQKATGAFMSVSSKVAARLVGAASPVASSVELHDMKLEGGVMRMFPVESIDLAAGRTVRLASGGYHIMLIGLKEPLTAGARVPLRLTFEFADRRRETLDVSAEVRTISGESRHAH